MPFGSPPILAALAAAPLALALLWLLWRHRRLHLLAVRGRGGGALLRGSRRGAGWRAALLVVVLVLLALAAARPQFGSDESALEQQPLGVVFVLDVSQSMSAGDLRPSRFDAAVTEVRRLVAARRTSRVGLVIFAGEPFVRFPLTLDHESALAVLSALQPGEALVRPGSNIAAAIDVALGLLQREGAMEGAIVVVSDGETHEGDAVAAARAAAGAGVRVFAAGVGTELGANVPAPGTGNVGASRIDARTGQPVLSRLDEASLRAIAAAGDGRYVRVDSPGAMGGLSADFSAIERTRGGENDALAPREQYQWFAGAALLLLLGGSLARVAPGADLARLAGRLGRRLRGAVAVATISALAMLLLTACSGSGAWRANEDGNEHFAAERYQDALESYREAQRRAPENPTINLNVGRALHELGKFDRAESATLGAMRSIDPAIRAVALFHAGNHRWANDDLLGARAAFIESLREQPDLLDAKINLEIVNALLRESGIKLQDDADAFGQPGETGDGPVGEGEGEGEGDPGEAEGADAEPGGEAGATRRGSQGAPTDRSGLRGGGAETPTFEETDRVAQNEAAQDALAEALEALPLEGASLEQAMAVLDALRAAPEQRFAAGRLVPTLEGIDDW